MSAKESGVLLALGAIWGASFMFIKVGGREMSPFALVEMRLALAAIAMLVIGMGTGGSGMFAALRAHWLPLTVMGIINCALPYTLITWGENYISSGLASIYNATAPLWAAGLLLVVPTSERLSPGRIVGLLVGMAGVMLVVSGSISGGQGEGVWHLSGQVACLLAALSYAISGLYGRHYMRGVSPKVAATGQLITGSILLLPLAAMQMPRVMPSWQALGAVAVLAVLGTAVASLMYYWLLAHIGATGTLLVTYLLPVFALGWGALLLGEAVTLPAVLGLVLVFTGIAITSGAGATLLTRLVGALQSRRGGSEAGVETGTGTGTGAEECP